LLVVRARVGLLSSRTGNEITKKKKKKKKKKKGKTPRKTAKITKEKGLKNSLHQP
jgi:hypothetical protein